MANTFEAKSRIPTRPLSFANIDMIMPKELAVDYTNGNIYVSDENGVVHDLSEAVAEIVASSEELAETIKVKIEDEHGEEQEVILETAIAQMAIDIRNLKTKSEEIQAAVDEITQTDPETGEKIIKIKPGDIIDDSTHRFVTDTQLEELSKKISIDGIVLTLYAVNWTGSEAPYTQTVSNAAFTANMPRPTIDINHYESEVYEDAMDAEDAWCKVYRAVTADGSITFYATEKPEVNLSVFVEIKKSGLSGVS